MDKPRHPGETSRAPRSHRIDEDFLLIKCLRKKAQNSYAQQFHDGDLIPTFDIFTVSKPEDYFQGNADEQKVWYFFCPKFRLAQLGDCPLDRLLADGCWRESSPREDIVDEQTQKIAEKRILRYRNWTMHELRLAVKVTPSPLSPLYVLCKLFKEEAADCRINEEANTATRGQMGQPTSSPNIPPDDRSDSKDPAEDDEEQAETQTGTESSSNGSSVRAERCGSTITTAASRPPGYNPGSTTEDSSTSS